MKEQKFDDTLTAALHYAEQGISVFPVHTVNAKGHCTCYKGQTCVNAGKHPAIMGWTKAATSDPEIVTQWFTESFNGFNIGILLGGEYVCLDIDVKDEHGKDGYAKIAELEKKPW